MFIICVGEIWYSQVYPIPIYIIPCTRVSAHYIIHQYNTVIGGNVTFGELLYEDNIVTGHRRRFKQRGAVVRDSIYAKANSHRISIVGLCIICIWG